MNTHPPTPATATRQDGFTIVEVLVASLVLAVGVVSLVGTFDPARRLGTRAELHQVASARAEEELNRVTSLAFKNIALKEAPTVNKGATTNDPTYFISSGPCEYKAPVSTPCYQWDWSSSSSIEALDVDATNGDATHSNPFTWTTSVSTSNETIRIHGSTYRFITWVNDKGCKSTVAAACEGQNDYKRVTVAVTISGMDTPVELSALVTNPMSEYDPIKQSGVTCTDRGVTVPCIG
jgi:prepilin-type N-terminal cleavage/methylation domain-containing protein